MELTETVEQRVAVEPTYRGLQRAGYEAQQRGFHFIEWRLHPIDINHIFIAQESGVDADAIRRTIIGIPFVMDVDLKQGVGAGVLSRMTYAREI